MKRDLHFKGNILCSLVLLLTSLLFYPSLVYSGLESYTYSLTQSTSAIKLWTTLPSEKVFKTSAPPTEIGSEVKVYAAKNEFEPLQVVVRPTESGAVTVGIDDFGSGITAEIFQVKYVDIDTATDYLGQTGDNPDPLWPISNGGTVSVTTNENTAFWFSLHIAKTTPSGDYTTNVSIGGVDIPVMLHVFNFAIPENLHVKSQMNFDYNTMLTKYGVTGTGDDYWMYVDKMKQFFIDHRMTPKSTLWSGGLTTNGAEPFIDYDCATGNWTDNDSIWGFEEAASRYLDGVGHMDGQFGDSFNSGVGYPSSMIATFKNNDSSDDQRPTTFCGSTLSASDWYLTNNPASPYNTKWFSYVSSMEDYLDGLGYLDKAYYYIANEPQDQADYDAVAWYSQELKKAAPHLKLMVSEEPKPEIYAHPDYPGAKIDIWMAHLGIQFDPETAFERMYDHDEETWIYFLHGTMLPRFNPLTIDHQGIEGKLLGWFLWKYRLRGFGYYAFNNWSENPWTRPLNSGQNGNLFLIYPPSETNSSISYGSNSHRFVPSIRLELMRDGLEDYEYFHLLNTSQQPEPYESNSADTQVDKVIGYTVAYSRDSEFLYNLRRVIGLKVGGEINSIPDLEPVSEHSRSDGSPGNYYINFQDPVGQPEGDVTYNGHTYMKIGDDLYDADVGYGWMKDAEVDDDDFYPHWDQWIDPEPKELLGSSVIDSWGREDVFEFDLPNGTYNVTACAGSRSSTRYQNIVIEGVSFMDNEVTNNSWITRTKQIEVKDKKLTLIMGKYKKIGYINYLDIEATYAMSDVNCSGTTDALDVIKLLKITSGDTANFSNCAGLNGDLNSDRKLDMKDVLGLLQLLKE
ncbi:DUF4091 domain-containing protein [Desulforhopalus sp. 52FAK]